jgi:hypothetical protein
MNVLWPVCGFCKPCSASARKDQINRLLDFERVVLVKHATAAHGDLWLVSSRPWLRSHVPDIVRRCP